MSKGQKNIRSALVILIMVVTSLLLYQHLLNKVKTTEDVPVTAVQTVLLKNLNKDYPASPREVIKYYNELQTCMYNDEYTDEEFADLANKALELYDDELVEHQNPEMYPQLLKQDITTFRDDQKKMVGNYTSSATEVEYYTKKKRQCANLRSTYQVRQGAAMTSTTQIFVMRKDEKGHWKILGWDIDRGE